MMKTLYLCYSFYNSIPFLFSGGSNINQNISLPQFDLRVNLGDNYATDYYDLSYPGVIMRIVLSRKMSFHLWQTYIPSSIFVVVAWLSTFVPPEEEKSCKYHASEYLKSKEVSTMYFLICWGHFISKITLLQYVIRIAFFGGSLMVNLSFTIIDPPFFPIRNRLGLC